MTTKEKLLNKLTEYFMYKNKELKPVVATLWVTKLAERYKPEVVIYALNKMTWETDDFPTLGKIAMRIDELQEDHIHNIFMDWYRTGNTHGHKVLESSNREIVRTNGDSRQRVKSKFYDAYKESNPVQIANDTKQIGE